VDLDIEDNIYRIINGYYFIELNNNIYKVFSTPLLIKQRANALYNEIIDKYKFDTKSWLSKQTIDYLLIRDNLWNKDKSNHCELLLKQLEKTKIELYLKFIDPVNRKNCKQLIQEIKTKINNYHNDKYYFYHMSLEGYAHSIKNQFIIAHTVYKNDELIFKDDWNNIDISLLDSISSEIYKKNLGLDEIRYLSKQELWKSFWSASKENVFAPPTTQWTDEQILIVNISKSLDSIREHPECPTEDIINDSDALDGWMLFQHDKTQKEKKKQQLEERLGLKNNKGGVNELFVLTDNKEEAREIFDLNDNNIKQDIKEIRKVAQSGKSVNWTELPHVQRDMRSAQKELSKRLPQ
jgi:hypothetical protein